MSDFWADRDWRINRMIWKFNRSGSYGDRTWAYEDTDEEIKKFFHEHVKLRENEIEIIVYFENVNIWTLLTSDRIIGRNSGEEFDIELNSITRIEPNFHGRAMNVDGSFKSTLIETLKAHTDQKTYTMCIEGPMKSGPHIGLWNVILMVMDMKARELSREK